MVVEDWGSESLNRNLYALLLLPHCPEMPMLRCCSPSETRSFLLSAIAFSGAAAVGISYTTAWVCQFD